MDFGMDGVLTIITQGTTAYLVEFSPVILFMAGLTLAFVFSEFLLDIVLYALDGSGRRGSSNFRQWKRKRDEDLDLMFPDD